MEFSHGVFVTGASGLDRLRRRARAHRRGPQVTGLARSDTSAAALVAAGAEVQRGTLDDRDIQRSAAAASDGVIHLAFKHDIAFSGDFQGAADADRRAVETFGEALAGTERPFLIAPGMLGVSGYIAEGTNRWPAVHRLDAARLFRLALETAPAGSVLHANAEEGVPIRAIAEVIGRHLNLPEAAISPEDAAEHFGFLAGFLDVDSPASSTLTRELLGWQATHAGLIDDLDKGHYCDNPSA